MLLAQNIKTSVFRNAVQLSVGFDTLLDLDPDLSATRSLQEKARRTWSHEEPTAAVAGIADATQVALPSPVTLAAVAAEASQLVRGVELVGWGVFVMSALDLDGYDLDRLISLVWYVSLSTSRVAHAPIHVRRAADGAQANPCMN